MVYRLTQAKKGKLKLIEKLIVSKNLELEYVSKYILHLEPIWKSHWSVRPDPIHESSQLKNKWHSHKTTNKQTFIVTKLLYKQKKILLSFGWLFSFNIGITKLLVFQIVLRKSNYYPYLCLIFTNTHAQVNYTIILGFKMTT